MWSIPRWNLFSRRQLLYEMQPVLQRRFVQVSGKHSMQPLHVPTWFHRKPLPTPNHVLPKLCGRESRSGKLRCVERRNETLRSFLRFRVELKHDLDTYSVLPTSECREISKLLLHQYPCKFDDAYLGSLPTFSESYGNDPWRFHEMANDVSVWSQQSQGIIQGLR